MISAVDGERQEGDRGNREVYVRTMRCVACERGGMACARDEREGKCGTGKGADTVERDLNTRNATYENGGAIYTGTTQGHTKTRDQ